MLKFDPKPGLVLVCQYEPGFKIPEMIKKRLAIVVSSRLKGRVGLCAVVPLSMTAPYGAPKPWEYEFDLGRDMPSPFEGRIKWAKCDMVCTIGYHRLTLPHTPRVGSHVGRKYIQHHISKDSLDHIKYGISRSMQLSTIHMTKPPLESGG